MAKRQAASPLSNVDLVSVHGGHSGQYCGHAQDDLASVVAEYARQGFRWVGLTEHMAASARFLPAEERAAGLDAEAVRRRFASYFAQARRLQAEYAGRMELFVAFETEAYSGYLAEVRAVVERFAPQYLVGSVHHVRDVPFDASERDYRRAVAAAGGLTALYCDYFDLQLELIEALQPAVVGHFDLVRIHDGDYLQTLRRPEVWRRAERNMRRIAALGLIVDFNVRALVKGQPEPYVAAPLLRLAKSLGVRVAPGDDSHGVATVGLGLDEGIARLVEFGFPTDWPKPC